MLLQIPEGAIPVSNGFQQRGVVADVAPFGVWQAEYFFTSGGRDLPPGLPALAAEKDCIVAAGEPFTFAVLEKPEGVDTTAWPHVSQARLGRRGARLPLHAQPAEHRPGAHRLPHEGQGLLRARRHPARPPRRHRSCGPTDSSTATRRPCAVALRLRRPGTRRRRVRQPAAAGRSVERLAYEQLEYAPLINPRAHPVGGKLDILNAKFKAQYEAFLGMAGKAALEPATCSPGPPTCWRRTASPTPRPASPRWIARIHENLGRFPARTPAQLHPG
ncbi:MAG: hypothetical protein U1G05_00560 [Kiritimatiellia bacterium]